MQKSELHTSAARRKGTFDMWQPRYAERGIATFPVRFIERNGKVDKVPAVCGYMRLGLRASTELTRKFADADGIGFALGSRNKIAVVDVDTADENVVADVFDLYGPSPLVARSPSGGHHVYYQHNGRQHRPSVIPSGRNAALRWMCSATASSWRPRAAAPRAPMSSCRAISTIYCG